MSRKNRTMSGFHNQSTVFISTVEAHLITGIFEAIIAVLFVSFVILSFSRFLSYKAKHRGNTRYSTLLQGH